MGNYDVSEVLARMQSDAGRRDREAALEDAREYIRRIQQLGFHVLFSAPLPVFHSVAFRCADWFNKMNPICHFGKSVSKRSLEDHRRYSVQQISELEEEFPGISIWDPFNRLCPGEDKCSSWDDQGPLFFDGDHLSGHGNQMLYPFFRQAVENVWSDFATSSTTQ